MKTSIAEKCRSVLSLAIIATTLFATTARAQLLPARDAHLMDGGAPRTWHVLPALYVQNVLIKFVLSSYGKSPEYKLAAMKEAETAIQKFLFQPRDILRVETLEELEAVKKSYFPAFNSIKDELKFRHEQPAPPFFAIAPGSQEIQDQLDGMWRAQEEKLESLGHLREVLTRQLEKNSVRQFLFRALDQGEAVRAAWSLMPDNGKVGLCDLMLNAVADGVTQIEQTGTVIAGSGALKHPNKGFQRFFELAIGEYFRHLDTSAKVNIVSAFLDNPDLMEPREKFELMVMNAGPQFQKLFQVYANQKGFGEDMKKIFKRLESGTLPAPFRLIKKEVAKLQNLSFQLISIEPVPIGVGTMAQVHRAKIRLRTGELKDVAVRVMKPGIEGRLKLDNETLMKIAPVIDADPILRENNFALLTPFVSEIIAMTNKELVVPDTVDAQRQAARVYPRDLQVGNVKMRLHVPELYSTGAATMIMVQEFIPGTSFEKFSKQEPALARLAAEEVAKAWLEQALIGGGFYHADLHQGNLRVGKTEDGRLQITLLDFGMTGELDKKLQSKIVALTVVLNSKRADAMADALWELTLQAENKISLPELRLHMQRELERVRPHTPDLGDWVSFAAGLGVKFPSDFTSLNRGLGAISELLASQNSKIDVPTLMKRLLIRNPEQIRNVLTSLDSFKAKDWWNVGLGTVGIKASKASRPLTCERIFAPDKPSTRPVKL